jgi:putative nucleotidyltransferase with HDIG domain
MSHPDAALNAAVAHLLASRVRRRDVPLPAFPGITDEIRAASSFGASLDEIAALVVRDRVLTSAVLEVANASPHVDARILSVTDAVQRLGLQAVERLSLTSALAQVAMRPGPLLEPRAQLWKEALAAAEIADAIAFARGLDPDAAWAAGLFHDFGKILALQLIEDMLGGAVGADVDAYEIAAEVLHVELSVALAEKWALPQPAPDVIAAHHMPALVAGAAPHHELMLAVDAVMEVLRTAPKLTLDALAGVAQLRGQRERADVLRALADLAHRLDAMCVASPMDSGAREEEATVPSDLADLFAF